MDGGVTMGHDNLRTLNGIGQNFYTKAFIY